MKHIIISALLLMTIGVLRAQVVPGNDVHMENLTIELLEDGNLFIDMDFVLLESQKLASNRMVTYTPILRANGNEAHLPSIYVYGRKRALLSQRNNLMPEDDGRVFRRNNGKRQEIRYSAIVPMEEWMHEAKLIVEQDICGCGNNTEDISYIALANVDLPRPKELPSILYRVPEPEVVKRRLMKGEAYIDFPVNQIVIYPDYMRNTIELAKIDSTLRGFNTKDILGITLHGNASPEGTYMHNTYLAQERTNALKNHITRQFGIPASIIEATSTPENWEGFIRIAESTQLPEKERILEIARRDIDPDQKEAELRKMDGAFRHMTRNWFPVLRYTNYTIEFIVPDFTAEEARIMVREDPSRLSLREMFDAARLSGKGTNDFYQLMEAAVLAYPDDSDANLNAAAAALEKGDIEAAEKYMEKVDLSTPEAKNNKEYINILKERQ